MTTTQGNQGDTRPIDPISTAVRLKEPIKRGAREHFSVTDPKVDVSKSSLASKILHDRKYQFLLILPNQIIFWLVIVSGLAGTVVPGLNFATAITWYVWFCVVFVLIAVIGRAWCAMCPFGGFAEWIQRRTLWKRLQSSLGLQLRYPEKLATYGLLSSAATFVLLTYIEEFFNIAGPGTPRDTSFMVIGIVTAALLSFLVFERRTFCRYVCPLSSVIGTLGAVGSAAGFRTKDRDTCLSCKTKDCMRGGEEGYGCPWYTWPGSADSNLYCGLCSECYKACPSGNVGLFVQKPLTSVISPSRRRADISWVVAVLLGLVVYQQINALSWYASLDGWLNAHTFFPHYPNPVDYFGFIALFAGVAAALLGAGSKLVPLKLHRSPFGKETFLTKVSSFRSWFVPGIYALIPVVATDYFARQLPKFFKHSPRLIPSIIFPFGGRANSLYNLNLLSHPDIVIVQVVIVLIGGIGSVYSAYRISKRDFEPIDPHKKGLATFYLVFVAVAVTVAMAGLYIPMHAAS